MAEKDPAWHGEQSASDDLVAPAHSTHEFLEASSARTTHRHDFSIIGTTSHLRSDKPAVISACIIGMCAGEHGDAIQYTS